jgi:hypothetical protein
LKKSSITFEIALIVAKNSVNNAEKSILEKSSPKSLVTSFTNPAKLPTIELIKFHPVLIAPNIISN